MLNTMFTGRAELPLIKKSFIIPCSGEECVELSNNLLENIGGAGTVTIEAKKNHIIVSVYGYKSDVKEVWMIIKSLVGERRGFQREEKGFVKISLNSLAKMLKKTIPPKLLIEILRKTGYYASYDENDSSITTNASLHDLQRIAETLSDVYVRVGSICRGTSTRYYLATLIVLTNSELEIIVGNAEKLDHVYRDEDGKIVIKTDWVKAVDEYIKTYGL